MIGRANAAFFCSTCRVANTVSSFNYSRHYLINFVFISLFRFKPQSQNDKIQENFGITCAILVALLAKRPSKIYFR